ncbi:MAG: TonB-dependent receptor, partial [Deltaproteobacteria bacterium]|nr:TonB-dependent receptor [Deltaproteobacteria bacterium]
MQLQNILIRTVLSIPLTLALAATPLHAAEESEPTDTSVSENSEGLPPVSAQKKKEVPEQISVIGQTLGSDTYFNTDTLWQDAPVDAGEALKVAPGISMIRKGGYANDLVLRGFSRDRLNMVIDGQKVHGAGPNRMDPPILQVDPSEIEALELVKGPFDVRHPGSMGGVVQLRTKDPKEGTHATLKTGAGSFDHQDVAGSVSHGGEKLSGLVGGAFRQGDPYKTGNGDRITEIYDAADPNRYLDDSKRDKAFEASNLWGKVIFEPQEGHKISLSASRQSADDVIYPYLIMDATKDKTLRAALSYDLDFDQEDNPLSKLHFALHWDDADHDMNNANRARSAMMEMLTEADSTTASTRFYAEFETLGGVLTSGLDYMQRDWDVDNYMQMMMAPLISQNMIPDTEQENFGAFLDYERDLSHDLRLQTGLRLDYNEIEAGEAPTGAPGMGVSYDDYWAGSKDSNDNTELSGNVRLFWDATDRLLVFTGLGRGVRMPDGLESYVARGVM